MSEGRRGGNSRSTPSLDDFLAQPPNAARRTVSEGAATVPGIMPSADNRSLTGNSKSSGSSTSGGTGGSRSAESLPPMRTTLRSSKSFSAAGGQSRRGLGSRAQSFRAQAANRGKIKTRPGLKPRGLGDAMIAEEESRRDLFGTMSMGSAASASASGADGGVGMTSTELKNQLTGGSLDRKSPLLHDDDDEDSSAIVPGLNVRRKDLAELEKLDREAEEASLEQRAAGGLGRGGSGADEVSLSMEQATRRVSDDDKVVWMEAGGGGKGLGGGRSGSSGGVAKHVDDTEYQKGKSQQMPLSDDGFQKSRGNDRLDLMTVKSAALESRFLQFCFSKSCKRTTLAICILGFIGVFCFMILGIAGVFESDSGDSSSNNGYDPLGEDPRAPPSNNVRLPHHIDRNVADWTEGNLLDGVVLSDSEVAEEEEEVLKMVDDVPFLWAGSQSGESVAEDTFGSCWKLVQASEVGIFDGHDQDTELKIVKVQGTSYVNVDTTSPSGISRAKKMDLVSSGVADVILSPLLHESVERLFSPLHRGRMMVIMRHPIHRAVSLYHYLTKATWTSESTEDGNNSPDISEMTLSEYATSQYVENNWFTRSLIDKPNGKLHLNDLKVAKEILRRKAVIGLYEDMADTLSHFRCYFGWKGGESSSTCPTQFIEEGRSKESDYERVREGSEEWTKLHSQNEMDMELYEYVKELVAYQMGVMPC